MIQNQAILCGQASCCREPLPKRSGITNQYPKSERSWNQSTILLDSHHATCESFHALTQPILYRTQDTQRRFPQFEAVCGPHLPHVCHQLTHFWPCGRLHSLRTEAGLPLALKHFCSTRIPPSVGVIPNAPISPMMRLMCATLSRQCFRLVERIKCPVLRPSERSHRIKWRAREISLPIAKPHHSS